MKINRLRLNKIISTSEELWSVGDAGIKIDKDNCLDDAGPVTIDIKERSGM